MIGDDEHSTCIFKAEATRMDFADSDFYILWLICKVCKSDVQHLFTYWHSLLPHGLRTLPAKSTVKQSQLLTPQCPSASNKSTVRELHVARLCETTTGHAVSDVIQAIKNVAVPFLHVNKSH